MEIPGEGSKTLMRLVDEVKRKLHKQTVGLKSFWEYESKLVTLEQPYKLYMTFNVTTGHWHIMDSSCTSSLPCVVQATMKTLDPKHINVTKLQVVVELFQGKQPSTTTSNHQLLTYVVLLDLVVVQNHSSRVPKRLTLSSQQRKYQGPGCLLCKHEPFVISSKFADRPDGEVSSLMVYREENITNHIHYIYVEHKSIAQLINRTIPQCNLVASLLKCCMHKEKTLQCVMVLRASLFPLSSLLEVGKVYRLHLPQQSALLDQRRTFHYDGNKLPLVDLPPDTAIFSHNCPLWSDSEPLADVKGMVHQSGNVFERRSQPQKFGSEIANKVDIPGFGVPGDRTAWFELRYNGTDSKCMYLNNWGNKLYPLALLRGAKVTVTNVSSKTSARGISYLAPNDLTGITVHSVPACNTLTWFPMGDISLISGLRPGSPISGVITAWKLLRADMKNICRCKAVRQKLVCPNVNCMATQEYVTVEPRARIITYGYEGPVIIHFMGDSVRKLLGFTKADWQTLIGLSLKTELKFNHSRNYNPKKHTYGQNVFRVYCHHPRLHTTLYLQCRKFTKEKPYTKRSNSNYFRRAKCTRPVPQIFAFEVSLSPPEGQLC